MSKNIVTMYSKSSDITANNIAAKEAIGYKKGESLFVNSFIGTKAGGVSYVNSKMRSTNDVQGAIINTGVLSDIGIDGAGLFAVSDSTTGITKYTRRGDFRQDELGYWKNGADQLLKAWKLDKEEKLPKDSSLLSSLEMVNFANTKGLPVKTSVISIAMNLNSDQKSIRGSGVDVVVNRSGLNSGTGADDILFPETLNNSSLKLGDRFELISTPPGGNPKVVEFGGMVLARRADNTDDTTIFGATGAGQSFTFAPDGAQARAGVLLSGQKLSVTISNGETYTFTAIQGQESAASGTFNTLNGLAAAINRINSLQARVDSTGRLYIAPTDANKGITFANRGGGNIVEELGLQTLDSVQNGLERFNSLRTLRDAVNKNQSTNSLLATIKNKDIKITSLLSTSEFAISGQSLGVNKISAATINPNASETDRARVAISAPGNDLVDGDLVKITGMRNGQIPDGIYSVSSRTSNYFSISLIDTPNNFPVAEAVPLIINPVTSWQKVPGERISATSAGKITAVAGNGNNQDLTITHVGHTLVQDDVIYLDGGTFLVGESDITLPSGYYHVSAVDGNTFTIASTLTAEAGGAPQFVGDTFNYRKVGNGGALGATTPTFNTTILTTADGADSNTIKYYVGNNSGYSVGDMITLSGLGGAQVVDGITINDNIQYKITEVDKVNGFVKFAVEDAGTATHGDEGATVLGDLKSYGNAAFTKVSTNNYSRFFEYFNIDQEKLSYDATYSANDADKNLISGNFDSSLTFSHPLTIFDSLGSSYTVILYFAKLDDNTWSVEVAAQRDENGVFDIDNLLTENGLLRSGIIKFDNNGALQGIPEGFADPIKIQRNNGSEQSSITIDWENTLSDIKTGTVSQAKNPNNVEIVQSNGQSAGTLLKLEIDPQGFIIGTFDSGETRKLYQVPIAIFPNVNGLIAGANGTFEISRESGELLLKQAGVGGAGRTLGGVLESSNVDTTEELLKVQELSNTIRANARVASAEFKNIATVLNELNN